MHGHKVFTFLESFSEQDILKFEKFLKCSYFGSRKKVSDFYCILKKYRKGVLEGSFTKEKIFQKLYPGNPFNKNTFNDLCAQLLRHAEEFLYIENMRNDKMKKELFLMEKYLEGNYESLFENKAEKVYDIFKNDISIDSDYFNNLYVANIFSLNYRQIYMNVKSHKNSDFILEGIVKATTNMLNYFLLETAGNYFDTFARQSFFSNNKVESDFKKFTRQLFNPEFLEILKQYNEHYYIVEVYSNMLNAFMTDNKNYLYFKYKSSVNAHIKKFSINEKHFHYSKLLSYCIMKLNKNKFDEEFKKEVSSIVREIITYEYYKSSKTEFLRPGAYITFLNNFFRSKDTESIAFLIKKCIPLMEKKFRPFYEEFSWSNYHFLSGNYTEALNCLNKSEIPFFPMHFRVKTLLIKIHYKLGNTEQVVNAVDTYVRFLKSNKSIPKDQRIFHENFAKFTRKIAINKDKENFEELAFLNDVIQKTPDVSYQDWLLEVIEDILTKRKRIKAIK